MGWRNAIGAKGFDSPLGPRRHRPRTQRRRMDDFTAPLDADQSMAALDFGARHTGGGPYRAGAPVASHVRARHRHGHQMVVRQHTDLGQAGPAGRRRGRGRSRRRHGVRAARRSGGRAGRRPVVRAAAGPGCHDDGLVRPGLVCRRASKSGVRHQRQRRPDGLVERPDRRRLGPGRRRPGRRATARRRRP